MCSAPTSTDEEATAGSALRRRPLRVIYPVSEGRIVLRTESDWEEDLEPRRVVEGQRHEFEVSAPSPILHYKPCLRLGDTLLWSQGANKLLFLGSDRPYSVYPHFRPPAGGRLTELIEPPDTVRGRSLRLRIYLPGGYDENHLKHYPVLYMQDGANVFFPEESFLGRDWHVASTLDLLDRMSLIDKTIVVGVHAGERMRDYTRPGYEAYARVLVTEVKPLVDERFRTLPGRRHTSLMGSSLGGVVSFYVAWEYPQVFGHVACLSSTFGWRDDLLERVQVDDLQPRRHLRIYLDSGWPGDNYEASLAMAVALVSRGFVLGRHLHHFAFPGAEHHEGAWGDRCHLPLQLFSGRLRRAEEAASGFHLTPV